SRGVRPGEGTRRRPRQAGVSGFRCPRPYPRITIPPRPSSSLVGHASRAADEPLVARRRTPSPAGGPSVRSATSPPHGGGEVGPLRLRPRHGRRQPPPPRPHRVGERSARNAERNGPGEGVFADLRRNTAQPPGACITFLMTDNPHT